MPGSQSTSLKDTDRSDSTASETVTETFDAGERQSAENRLENAIDQAALAINQLKARGDALGERRAREAYSELRAARKHLEAEDDGGEE